MTSRQSVTPELLAAAGGFCCGVVGGVVAMYLFGPPSMSVPCSPLDPKQIRRDATMESLYNERDRHLDELRTQGYRSSELNHFHMARIRELNQHIDAVRLKDLELAVLKL